MCQSASPSTVVSGFRGSCLEFSSIFDYFRLLKTADIHERHAVIEFCFLFGCSAANAVDMLSAAYKEYVLKKLKFLSGIRVLNVATCRLKTINARVSLPEPMKMLIQFTVYENRRRYSISDGISDLRLLFRGVYARIFG